MTSIPMSSKRSTTVTASVFFLMESNSVVMLSPVVASGTAKFLANAPLVSWVHLAGGVRCCELGVCGGPDSFDAAAGTNEESRRGEGHKGHQQRVLDEILALFVCCEVTDEVLQFCLSFCLVYGCLLRVSACSVAYLATTEVLARCRVGCRELAVGG